MAASGWKTRLGRAFYVMSKAFAVNLQDIQRQGRVFSKRELGFDVRFRAIAPAALRSIISRGHGVEALGPRQGKS